MSTNERFADTDGQLLGRLLSEELINVPISQWGYFYPCHVAVWRFIELKRPGVLGTLSSGYDDEPYYRGEGAEWFCDTLGNTEAYLDEVEKIMYAVVDGLSTAAKKGGFLLKEESPALDADSLRSLAAVVLAVLDQEPHST